METILKFDRVILIKELNDKIKKVGDVFEIANILDNSFLLREVKSKVAVGVVNFEDFEKHFVTEENFKGWTKWTPIVGYDGQSDAIYRTNRKKIQVKFITDNVRAESCCRKGDDFNLSFGVQLAYLRCRDKALMKKATEHEEALKKIDIELMKWEQKQSPLLYPHRFGIVGAWEEKALPAGFGSFIDTVERSVVR